MDLIKNGKNYLGRGKLYLAAASFAEAFASLQKYKDADLINSLSIDDHFERGQVVIVRAEMNRKQDKIVNILSHGNTWYEDELISVLSIFIELIQLQKYFIHFGVDHKMNLQHFVELLENIDKRLNRVSLNRASNLIKSNWPEINIDDYTDLFTS